MTTPPTPAGGIPALLIGLTLLATPALASAQAISAPWFGLQTPEGLGDPHRSPVSVTDVTPPAANVPGGEEVNASLRGEEIRRDLERIVGFAKESRASGEQMWGRISGRPAAARTAEWVASRFREIGLREVEVQTFASTAEMWWPERWEVRIVADPSFGVGTRDVVLESALPTSGSSIRNGALAAPLAFAGTVGETVAATVDLSGKVAVQHLRPGRSAYSERSATVASARALFERGAVAVINVVSQPGNMHVRDFSNCGGPCFNVGGADGDFLLGLLERARRAGMAPPTARLSLQASMLAGVRAQNVVGVIPGDTEDVGIVNAHLDGWFDGAGDNGDGLAVLLALARYFVEPDNRPVRTLVFVASAGHHSPGMNGPSHFVRMNPEIGARTDFVLNLEHVAQLELSPVQWTFAPTEQTMSFGISNESPYLQDVARRGMQRYGFRLNPAFSASVPGDLGGYGTLDAVRVQAIHSGPLYHTSGDVLETISVPGLERAARFFAYFVREAARAPRGWLDPPAPTASAAGATAPATGRAASLDRNAR